MSDVYIKIKMDEKQVTLKSSTLNNGNLDMMFRLHLNQRRGDNSPIRYWLLPRLGLGEDVLCKQRTNESELS